MIDITEINKKFTDFQTKYARMDRDRELYQLKPYEMVDLRTKKALPDVINVTNNDPKTLANQVITRLATSRRQVVVESEKLEARQVNKIESFVDDVYYMIDERLRKIGMTTLQYLVSSDVVLCGTAIVRCWLWEDEAKGLIFDVVPWAPRYVCYEYDYDGMAYGAYKTRRSAAQIARGYKKDIDDKYAEVTDVWDREDNHIYIGNNKVKVNHHGLGYVPVAIVNNPSPHFIDDGSIEFEGESIFESNRGLYEAQNEASSTAATLNRRQLTGGYQYESEAGEDKVIDASANPHQDRPVIPVDKGGGFKKIPMGDVNNSTTLLMNSIDQKLQQGGVSKTGHGQTDLDLSGKAITTLATANQAITVRREMALNGIYKDLTGMIIGQFQKKDSKASLKRNGRLTDYSAKDFEGHYDLSYKFTAISLEDDAMRMQMANASRGYYSEDTIKRDILQVKNPEDEKKKQETETAERMYPVLFMYRQCVSLIEEKKYVEARLVKDQLKDTIQKMHQAQQQQGEDMAQEGMKPQQAGLGAVALSNKERI